MEGAASVAKALWDHNIHGSCCLCYSVERACLPHYIHWSCRSGFIQDLPKGIRNTWIPPLPSPLGPGQVTIWGGGSAPVQDAFKSLMTASRYPHPCPKWSPKVTGTLGPTELMWDGIPVPIPTTPSNSAFCNTSKRFLHPQFPSSF